jgi:hypothetical protein
VAAAGERQPLALVPGISMTGGNAAVRARIYVSLHHHERIRDFLRKSARGYRVSRDSTTNILNT